jgi:hypothetical protein
MTEIDGCKIIGRASDYSGLVSALRERSAELGVTRENLDALSGVQSGYSAIAFGGPNEIAGQSFVRPDLAIVRLRDPFD